MPYDVRRLYSPHISTLSNNDPQVRAYRTFLTSVHQQPYLAVVDESYRKPASLRQGKTRQGFYTLTATIVKNENFPVLREEFLDITSYWHTTEAGKTKFAHQAKFDSGNWQGNILPMLEVSHAHAETNLVTVHAKIPYTPKIAELDRYVENARKECITTMMKVLTEDPQAPTSAVIFEGRRNGTENYLDQKTLTDLKNAGIISSGLKYTFTSSSIEPVLWAADLGAWATQRFIRYDDPTWLQKSQLKVHWFDAQSGKQFSFTRQNKRPVYIEFGRIHRDIEAGKNLETHQATLEKAAQGLLDNKINTGIPDTPALRKLSQTITQLPISPQQAQDLEVGRGEKSVPQQTAYHLLRNIKNKVQKEQDLGDSPDTDQSLTQKIHDLKQQAVQRHQEIKKSSSKSKNISEPLRHKRSNSAPQRGQNLR